MASMSPELHEALCRESSDDWRLLTKKLTYHVACLLGGRVWRGLGNGVPPDGHDAGSIAAEAISQLFAGSDWKPRGNPYEPSELWFELVRLARNIVRKLERRKENATAANEPDLSHRDSELSEEGFFDNLPGYEEQPDVDAQRNEARLGLQRFQEEFKVALGPDEGLKQLFDCICEGRLKRVEQATLLKLTPKEITNARKRLDRRLEEFATHHPNYPTAFIQEIKNA